ncbi:hypothetical protein CTRI78_v005450 [Colletotrichum trifolii]|uniref:Uncharacterized protein n=1 Tax=Colletotrichum trifolii TaxID=5466 RepID=A0A4R8RHV1_COLTR|nr:hypothetical protein CTRI78_v005450 [Colletotrichum trifolii]
MLAHSVCLEDRSPKQVPSGHTAACRLPGRGAVRLFVFFHVSGAACYADNLGRSSYSTAPQNKGMLIARKSAVVTSVPPRRHVAETLFLSGNEIKLNAGSPRNAAKDTTKEKKSACRGTQSLELRPAFALSTPRSSIFRAPLPASPLCPLSVDALVHA